MRCFQITHSKTDVAIIVEVWRIVRISIRPELQGLWDTIWGLGIVMQKEQKNICRRAKECGAASTENCRANQTMAHSPLSK